MTGHPFPPQSVLDSLRDGLVIPAHPLALTRDRKFDERHQRALTRYYHAAGAGGVAVGVHATQFEIRHPQHELLRPVLELAVETIRACDAVTGRQSVCIAGIYGNSDQATAEAALAAELGYHAGLLSLATLQDASDDTLIAHCERVAERIPLMGFYLQPAAGGRLLSYNFWRRFVEIPNVVAIKVAPFNRYQTFDVVRAVAEAGRVREIALYTGNDDNIVIDLLTTYQVVHDSGDFTSLQFAGGLLGHWACWTQRAVSLLSECKAARTSGSFPARLLTLAAQVTDANAALFDTANQFNGVNPGIHEVLRQQGLLANNFCLNPDEVLSPGQLDEIRRIHGAYPDLNDDAFVREHLDEWLR